MSRYKRYERYKDSGVEWIGEIPEHWGVKPLKRVFKIINGGTPSSSEESYWNGEIVWVTPNDLSKLTEACIVDSERKITQDGLHNCSARIVPKGSIVISTRAPIGYVAIAGVPLCTNQGCKSLVPTEAVNNKYFYYWMHRISFYLNVLGLGTTFIELSNNSLSMVELLTPSISEQKAIANFLDQKTTEIDDLIADKEKLIELLQEKRQAIITEAVTKGLNPSVKMKDSGVEWIGEIPEHWEIGRLKNSIKSCRNGIWGDEPQGDNNDIACIRVTDFNRTNMEIEVNDLTIRNIPASKQKLYLLKYGDLLIEKSGGGEKQPVGFVTIFKHNIPAVYANFIARIELDKRKAYSGFFKYIYSAMYSIRLNVRSIKQTTGIQNLDTNYYFDERVMYPPLNEQIHIANFLDQKTAEIDDLITEIKLQIQKLKEYRQSLISEAVTGKIDVREFQNKNEVIFRNE